MEFWLVLELQLVEFIAIKDISIMFFLRQY